MKKPPSGVPALLRDRWVEAAVYTGAMLLLLAPLAWRAGGAQTGLIYLCGIAYLAHQIEEHWHDRFRRFVNDRIYDGDEILTPAAIWWINVPGVWGVNLGALYAATLWGGGAGLAAPYLMLVNGAVHIAGATRFGYNPGLATATLLFFPLGLYALAAIPASSAEHGVGAVIALLIHGVIVAALTRRAAAMRA